MRFRSLSRAPAATLERSPLGAVRTASAGERRVLLTTPVPQQRTAWTKARQDVQALLRGWGYEVLEVPHGLHPRPWLQLLRKLRQDSPGSGHLLIEYPFPQRRRAYLLALVSRLAGLRLYALLHDLDSLRFSDSPPARELAVLDLFDGLITHNRQMSQWLRDGFIRAPLAELNLFDYLAPPPPAPVCAQALERPLRVACCGNLSWDKAGYVYDPQLAALPDVHIDLYGAFFEAERMPDGNARFRGVFDPDRPALEGRYHFGLVWDGSGVDRCSGNYGHYMRFNNPHKLSLYVALGLPVIVWQQAAVADFVQRCGIGVTVRDLREIGTLGQRVSDAEWRQMARNVAPLGEAVRSGQFLRDALVRLQR
jgi:hypothetical protein